MHRGTELEQLLAAFSLEVSARQTAEETLRDNERRLAALVARLFIAQEDERRRIAYEIHDGPAQLLAGAYQYFQAAESLFRDDPEEARRLNERGLTVLRSALNELRQVIRHLRPTLLTEVGLSAALQRLIEDMRAETDWELTLNDGIGDRRLRPEVEIAAFRIIQEALTNARKHAGASRVRVRATVVDGGLVIRIRDWGRGFDRSAVSANVGLESMVERALLLGGKCRIISQPGRGTTVSAWLPRVLLQGGEV